MTVDPANRLVADTLETDWNTSLRAQNEAQEAMTTPASNTSASSPAHRRPGSSSWSPTCPRSGTTPPPRPGNASASPGYSSPTSRRPEPATPSPRTSACPADRTTPCSSRCLNRPGNSARPPPRSSRRSMNYSTTTPTPRSLTSPAPAAWSAARTPLPPPDNHAHPRPLPAAHPRTTAAPPGPAHPAPDRRLPRRVHLHRQEVAPHRDCQRPMLQRQRTGPLRPPGPNPPTPHHGLPRLTDRRTAQTPAINESTR